MPRLPRFDAPGRWFHVMNRGIAKRTVFETEADIRYFLSRVARAVRRGELEVHAFCVLATHFHLLVRSPTGQLSEAMRRIQNEYVRYFNRSRGRDGPLFRGRFTSRPVRSMLYRCVLVRYIDRNPVSARLASAPWEYPFGSARRFVKGPLPRWLASDWILGDAARGDGSSYIERWGAPPTASEAALVESRLAKPGLWEDPLDDLVGAAPARVRDWMTRKSVMADGTKPGIVCVPAVAVLEAVRALRKRHDWRYATATGQRRCAWEIATCGLLHQLGGLTQREIADRTGARSTMVSRRLRAHRTLCGDETYARRLARVATLVLRHAFPGAGGEGRRKVRKWS